MNTLGLRDRKWEIFTNAIDLFASHGYENVPMRTIAEATNIKASSLYNHFPSKESILSKAYEFYQINVPTAGPNLEKVLEAIPKKSVNEILHLSMGYYTPELQPYMDKIYRIAIMQAHLDPKAFDVVWGQSIDYFKKYFHVILEAMIDQKRIKPLDIDNFLDLLTSYAFASIFRSYSPHTALGYKKWTDVLNTLFSIIIPY